jgi:hypothetical protein
VNEGVHDNHSLLGDTSVGVNLLEHLVDVAGVRGVVRLLPVYSCLTSPLGSSLSGGGRGLGGGLLHLGGSLRSFLLCCSLLGHCDVLCVTVNDVEMDREKAFYAALRKKKSLARIELSYFLIGAIFGF